SAVFCLRSRTHADADVLQGTVAASSRSEPVRRMPEACLEDRFQNVLDRALHHAITHCRGIGTSPVWRGFGISFRLNDSADTVPSSGRFGVGLGTTLYPPARIPVTVIQSTPAVRRPLFRVVQFHKSG